MIDSRSDHGGTTEQGCVQTTQDGIISCKGEMQVMMNIPSHDHSAINVSVFNDWFISKDEMYARRRGEQWTKAAQLSDIFGTVAHLSFLRLSFTAYYYTLWLSVISVASALASSKSIATQLPSSNNSSVSYEERAPCFLLFLAPFPISMEPLLLLHFPTNSRMSMVAQSLV